MLVPEKGTSGNRMICPAMLVLGFFSTLLGFSLLLWGTSGREPWERVCGATYHTNAIILSWIVITVTVKFFEKRFWMKLQFLNLPFSFLFCLQDSTFAAFISERYVEHRVHKEKSLRHVAMVAKCLDDNKPIKSLKSLFALFQTSPILFNFI